MNKPAVTHDVSPPLLKQSRLVELTSHGDSLHQVASTLLRKELRKRYPDLHIDPDHTLLATPVRNMDTPQMAVEACNFESLTHVLIRQSLHKTTAELIEGEHFLTHMPIASPPLHLAVSMDELTTLLNDHAPLLFVECQQRQLDYWNESEHGRPRWQELSEQLRSAADVQTASGWDAEACRLARFVAQYPDKAERPTTSDHFTGVRACIMDIDRDEGSTATHSLVAGALVITATISKQERILLYTIADGYETYDSLKQLGESLPERIDPEHVGPPMKWRLIEPDGNVFDAVAQALVANQLVAIAAQDPANPPRKTRGMPHLQITSQAGPLQPSRLSQLKKAIPDWLKDASAQDLQNYSRYLVDLGALRDGATGNVFKNDDCPEIKPYAEQKMQAAMLADTSVEGVTDLPLDRLRITVTDSLETAGFTLANPLSQVRETLGEFALQNTPPYQASIDFDDARPVPAWLTVDYLSALAAKVDIGRHYPKLLKRNLVDDPIRAADQKTRYTLQLPILLPLLALECKIRHQGGVDERGHAYVCQLMDAIASKQPSDKHPVTIRPLAFTPVRRLSGQSDTVTNMYIIGPRDHRQGPCLLYRPMMDMPLMQFASLQNLMYALYQPGELRNSVLAWLGSPSLSFEYSQYVFSTGLPSPWMVTQLAFEPFMHLDLNGPIKLANQPLTGDILGTLHTANSQALIELADRQSVSNSERRWALLADSGWAIFSIASNFLSGAAGAAAWAWQTIEQVQQTLDAHEHGEHLIAWKSAAEVLLTLGILLTHRVVARRNHSLEPHLNVTHETPEDLEDLNDLVEIDQPQTPPFPAVVTHDPVTLTGDIPVGHHTLLEPALLPRPDSSARFLAMLESFKVDAPDLSGKQISSTSHLYTDAGKTYAQVGSRWFQVSALKDEPVYIIHPRDPLRTGMSLEYDVAAGQWHWAPRLRLRGGSPTGRIEAMLRAKEQKKDAAWLTLQAFLAQEPANKRELLIKLLALPQDNSEATYLAAAPDYLDMAIKQGDSYTQALEHLATWHQNGGGGVFYQAQLMRMTAEQHRCMGSWLRVKMRLYSITSKRIAESFDSHTPLPRNEQIDIATRATTISDELIATLQTLNRSLLVLVKHSGKGAKLAKDLRRLLPNYGELDLKANEIGMSYERCVNEGSGPQWDAARQDIGIITIKAADAGHELLRLSRTTATPDAKAERIEQLSRWNDLLTSLDDQVEQLPSAHPGQFIQARLDRTRELIGEFRTLAQEHLIAELPEPVVEQHPETVRQEPQPSTSQPKVKISKTRPRQNSGNQAPAPDTSEAGEESPFVKFSAHLAKPFQPVDDDDLISKGMELNGAVDAFIKKTREDARRPGRIPADIRDMFDQQASRLEQTANDVDMAFARRRAASQNVWPVASLSPELRAGATATRTEGNAVYGAMLKQRKPRETYFRWLHENGQVDVVKDERGRIRTRQRGDYFQEYRILDKANGGRPMWVAHFHYERMSDADAQYTIAHLKFADAYLQSLDEKTRLTLSTFDAVDNAMRRIVDPTVRDLFLKPQAVASR
ncbi:dermonecrotic toxin domain-containing protein [Pseudomonas fluorescens]|uniref:dermonecrotic toxin domain-containing protein n=1 Tax=Pseudomonas fluorescens TaxID=294 RepID=UPI001F0730D9|nr:DUF6543 domain-containing protein [Pseudomonas fluorescens]